MLGGHIVGRTQSWEDAECGNRGGDDLSKTRTQPLVVGKILKQNHAQIIESVCLGSCNHFEFIQIDRINLISIINNIKEQPNSLNCLD